MAPLKTVKENSNSGYKCRKNCKATYISKDYIKRLQDPPNIDFCEYGYFKVTLNRVLRPVMFPDGCNAVPPEVLKMFHCNCAADETCSTNRCSCSLQTSCPVVYFVDATRSAVIIH